MKNSSTNRRSLFVNSWPFRWYNRRRKIRPADSHARINERSGSAVNETPRTERRAGGKRRKTEKRNKGPIKTNWFSSPRPFVHRSARRRARSVRQILRSFRTHSHILEYLRGIRTYNLVKIYRRTPACRVISVVCRVCVRTWRYTSPYDCWINDRVWIMSVVQYENIYFINIILLIKEFV